MKNKLFLAAVCAFGLLPLAGCSNPAVELHSGDLVFTRNAYIDLENVPEKISVEVEIPGSITRGIFGSRTAVSASSLGYQDGILTIDTSILYDDEGNLAITAGEQTLRLFTSEGTVEVPILLVTKVLKTAQDILDLNDYIENPDAMAGSYILGNDIDLSSVENFEPLGYSDSVDGTHYQDTFNGVFDGNGYTISGVKSRWNSNLENNENVYEGNPLWTDISHSSGDNWGFFQEIGEAGVVRNVRFADCSFAGRSIVGTVAGIVSGKIENVIVDSSCSVMASTHFYDESCNAAGIVGIVGANGSLSTSLCLTDDISIVSQYTDYGDAYLDSDVDAEGNPVPYHVYYTGSKGMTDSNGVLSTGVYGGAGLTYGTASNSFSVKGGESESFSQTHLEANKPGDGPDSGNLIDCGSYSLSGENSLSSASLYGAFDTSVWNIIDGQVPTLAASYPYVIY